MSATRTSDFDDVLEELFYMKEKIIDLEKDNVSLKRQLDNMKALKDQMEVFLMEETVHSKNKPKKREKSVYQKGLESFYHEHKKNDSIINNLKERLNALGYIDSNITWYMIKLECKKLYDTLNENEKQNYIP
jgi:hypothetical protein